MRFVKFGKSKDESLSKSFLQIPHKQEIQILRFRFVGKGIKSASFTGYGCAISKASTEVLSERLHGKSMEEVRKEIALFLKVIDPEGSEAPEAITDDETLLAFAGTRQHPERDSIRCRNCQPSPDAACRHDP